MHLLSGAGMLGSRRIARLIATTPSGGAEANFLGVERKDIK